MMYHFCFSPSEALTALSLVRKHSIYVLILMLQVCIHSYLVHDIVCFFFCNLHKQYVVYFII